MLSIVVSHKPNIPSITLIHEIVFKILGKIAGAWKYDHNDLDLISLNVDMINMSDAHPSLRSYLYKQTATYYFIGVSQILTSSPTLGHDPGGS